jgi:hypothetical protein
LADLSVDWTEVEVELELERAEVRACNAGLYLARNALWAVSEKINHWPSGLIFPAARQASR